MFRNFVGAHNSGSYTFDGDPAIAFTHITSFTVNGKGNSNTLTVIAPGWVDFSQPGQITIDDPFTLFYTGVGTLNVNNAVAVNAIAGPDTADRAAAFTGLTSRERFVQALYLDEPGRPGSKAELDVWLTATGAKSRGNGCCVRGRRGIVAGRVDPAGAAYRWRTPCPRNS